MILFLAYVFFALAFIMVLVAAYNIYCIITLRLLKKEVCESPNTNVEDTKTRFNLFIWIIKKSRKVKNASSPNEIEKAVKKKVKTFTFILIFAIFSNIYSAFEFVIYGSVIYTLNQQFTTVSSAFNTLFGHDEDCPCYALCTGNEEDDVYSVYELLFGPDEYNKLIGLMDLTDEEYERIYGTGRYGQELKTTEEEGYLQGSIKVINTSSDGRAKSEFIRDHINDDMVNAYRDLVSHNPKFRHGDGNDRSKMTQEQLRDDLYKLLSDYKVHGRNPNCKCNTANKLALKKVCLGEEHWHEGWTWGTFYYPEPTYDEDGNPVYPDPDTDPDPTKRTKAKDSIYGIELDNGEWYYWYQQRKSCKCAHNVEHPTYGRYGSIYLYNPNSTDSKNTAAARGCSTYSTAMAISNALQMEVTPYNVILDLMGGTLSPYLDSYILSGTDGSGLILSKAPPTMIKSTFAARITSYYKKYGLEANAISLSQANVDAVLDKGGFVQCSVKGKFAWYGGDGSHFIVIRKRSGDNYYCLDSAVDDAKAVERMTTPVNWATLSSHFQNSDGISYWADVKDDGGDDDYDLSASDQELLNIFLGLGVTEAKAYGMLACYKAATEQGLSSHETVGLLGCAMCEGTPGLVQYNHTLGGVKSTQGSPVIIDTPGEADSAISGDFSQDTGAGTAQWTNGRLITYGGVIKSYTKAEGLGSDAHKILWRADYDMYTKELSGSYRSLITDMKNHNSSVEAITVFSMFKYEAGWGNYKNSDRIEDYSGTFRTYLEARYANADAVDKALKAHANK